ncbi:MAG: YopX family protein [Candidatus Paceibacterota bacterium]|jgi:uncharacterized phage protein (TIGR01671 family)
MQRQLKFRAWDTDEKYMYDVPLAKLQFYPESRYHILQWTGLLDKNGKEIYEGDIVTFEYHNGGGFSTPKVEVKFNRGAFCVWQDTVDTYISTMEIIGDIYSNPELLTV